MDILIQAKAAEHLVNLISKREFTPPIGFVPQKPACRLTVGDGFEKVIPEKTGLSSGRLKDMLSEIAASKEANVHQILVVKDRKTVLESALYPYRSDIWHVTHSAAKTVTAMAIGILITRGLLNEGDRLTDIFDNEMSIVAKIRLSKITVKHLLTMSSGLTANELMIVSEKDWLRAALESGCHFEPGSRFQYNSINSYLLASIVQKVTGQRQFDFLKENLFGKLGITEVFWETCPMGRTKGGWGLYMLPADLSKLGVLLLDKGKWQGETVIGESFVSEMIKPQISAGGSGGYGYQLWMGRKEGSFYFNGMLGQNVHCFPHLNTVAVVTGGNAELFGKCYVNDIINKYFTSDLLLTSAPLPNKKEYQALKKAEAGLYNPAFNLESKKKFILSLNKLPKEVSLLTGKCYESEGAGLCLLPFFPQLLGNCYPKSVKRLEFSIEGGTFYVNFKSGSGENKIPVGFDKFIYCDIDIEGEIYKAAAKGRFSENEDGVTVFTVSLPFLEHSSGRLIKIFIEGEKKIRVRFYEIPGRRVIEEGIEGLSFMFPEKSGGFIKRLDPSLIGAVSSLLTEPEGEFRLIM